MKLLVEQDWIDSAERLGCEVAAIKAVAYVESGGRSGFLRDGINPKILFEGHWFHKLTKGRFTPCAQNENISHKRWTKKWYNQSQHSRLQKAVRLDREAALKSASWGKFQIMGFNHRLVGFDNLQGFVNAMYRHEREHLKAFEAFVVKRGIDDELRRLDWVGFAYVYNGSGFAKNKYDKKMAKAYKFYKKQENE